MTAHVSFAEFQAAPSGVCVGWAEFYTQGFSVCMSWAEFDVRAPSIDAVPPYRPGGGVSRYHSETKSNYEVVVDAGEAEEEDIVLRILMEIAKNELC